MEKYNRSIPKTWDQLYETGKYILEKERNVYNNTDLTGYNSLFTSYIYINYFKN